MSLLLEQDVVLAWLSVGSYVLDRLDGAAAALRRALDAGDALASGRTFAARLLAFDDRLQLQVAAVRAAHPELSGFGLAPPGVEPPTIRPVVEPAIPVAPPAPEPVPPEPPETEASLPDLDPTRVILAPTALMPEVGRWNARTLDIGYWVFQVGLSPHVMLQLETTVPVMNFGLLPGAKFSVALAEGVQLGATVQTGFWLYYPDVSFVAVLYGGTVALTFGSPDLFLNVGLMAYGVTAFEKGDAWDRSTFGFLSPNLGGSIRVARSVKLNVELHAPAVVGDARPWWTYGELWVLMYGLRILGERLYGDVAFALPLFDEAAFLLQFMPIGFPMLDFGVTW